MKHFRLIALSFALSFVIATSGVMAAGPAVEVVIGPESPPLEKLAANELAGQFHDLFDADVKIVKKSSAAKTARVLIGSPATNPAVKDALGANWPKLSEQGHLLRSKGGDVLVVGGGSPVATLWAVYELGQRFGMRYTVHGDKIPAVKPDFKLSGYNVVLEPEQRERVWRTVNDFVIGPESWGLAEQERMLGQLAKLKYNRVMLSIYPWQPFVDYKFRGVQKQTGTLFFGNTYRVDGDTPGRATFGGLKYFTNPDFADAKTYAEMSAAGETFLTGVIDAAHGLGMKVGISISPLEFPKEFAAALPEAPKPHGLKKLVIGPGPKQTPDDPLFQDLVKAKIRAYLKTYPQIDHIYFTMPEFPDWVAHAETSWNHLKTMLKLGEDIQFGDIIQDARNRNVVASAQRGENSVKGNITALYFLHRLAEDKELFVTPTGKHVKRILTALDPALFPMADKLVSEDVEMLHFVDYTAGRVVANKHFLATLPPAAAKRSMIILTLADDNIGVLPQLATANIHELLTETRRLGWAGYSTRYWLIGDLDPTLHYMSRASFDSSVTPKAAYDDLFDGICGPGVSQRTTLAFLEIEKATAILDKHNLGFAFPVPSMVMKHYTSSPAPEWWKDATAAYTEAMIEMYRAQTRAGKAGRNYILYHAKRHEFAVEYFGAITALHAAAQAKKAGDTEKQLEELLKAVEGIYNATTCLGEVAVSNSDRGLIAVMTKFGYRPLVKEYERVEAGQ